MASRLFNSKQALEREVKDLYLKFTAGNNSAATAILDLTNDITLTSVASGPSRNTNTFTTQVVTAQPNPTNTVLANFSGTSAAIVCTITPNDGTNTAPTPPSGSPALLTSASYAVLASSTITNTGATVLTGNLGLYPGTSVTGFPPGTVSGVQHITDAAANQAMIDAGAAYTDLSTRSATSITANLDGQTLSAGVYTETSGTFNLATSGNATLTLNGSATDIFVFRCSSTLITGAGGTPTIALTGGALASNVYWVCGSSATINVSGTGAFKGTVIATASVTVDGGSGTSDARFIALTGAVTFSAATTSSIPVSITPVYLTTAELRELISTGAVSGKSVTITDASSLRILQTATGGGAQNMVDGGEGDGVVAIFSGGVASQPSINSGFGVTSVVRNDVGDYTITFDDAYMVVKYLRGIIQSSSAQDIRMQIKADSIHTKSVRILLLTGATAVDPSNGTKVLVKFELKNSGLLS
jgi:hypothetical protein